VTSANRFRIATVADAASVAKLVARFYKRDGGVYRIPFDYESCLDAVADVLVRGVCVIGPKSCAGAHLVQWPFNKDEIVAQVFFWCFEDTREVAIFDYLLQICQQLGATFVNVAAIGPKHSGKQFYQKRGLKCVETHFLGPLKACK